MRFFSGVENNLSDYCNAYQRGFLQQEANLLHESDIRLTNGLGFLFDNIPLQEQPCFSSFNDFNDFTTDLQALIAKPLICLWLANMHALRVELQLGLSVSRYYTPEVWGSMVACVCYNLRAALLLITEALHFALRLAITAAVVTKYVIHPSGILSAVPLDIPYQNII